MLYFAYGSNMCPERLGARVRGAYAIGVATLPKHELRWHKRSNDGSAKCDAFRVDDASAAVIGVLYELSDSEMGVLDTIEGVGHGYVRKRVQLATTSGARAAETYVALCDAIDPELSPYDWYLEHVLCGAHDNLLPTSYIEAIRAVRAIVDANKERRSRELGARGSHAKRRFLIGRNV